MSSGLINRWFGGKLIAEQMRGVNSLLVVAFALIALVVAVAAGATYLSSKRVAEMSSLQLLTESVNVSVLQLRRKEKDFFERKTLVELEAHAEAAKKTKEQLAKMLTSLDMGMQADDVPTIELLQKNLTSYLAEFKRATDAQTKIGLTEKEGVQGVLRQAAGEVEDALRKIGNTELTASILQLRRLEKDFALREQPEYVKAHADELARFKSLLNVAKLDPGVRTEVTDDIVAYEKAFASFVEATFAVNKGLELARTAAREFEKPLPELTQEIGRNVNASASRSAAFSAFLAVVLAVVLVLVVFFVRRALNATIKSIGTSVDALQDTVNRVRGGQELKESDGVQSKDEMGAIWTTVHGLLTDRRTAQLKAEAENEQLNNSVISILQSVNDISNKDLTVRALVTSDIIGTVSDSINHLTEETGKVLQEVSDIANQVENNSNNVRSQAQLVTTTAAQERHAVSQMIESLADATQYMNQVAALTENASDAADQATQVTDSALQTVNGTVKGMDAIRETIAEAEKRIKRLGERSQEISGIVNLINTISERTHVLALNASMQAAVAGEAGRGFAVVAEEVQRLAESSRNATQQIAALVGNIQLETNETINTVNQTIGQVVSGSELAQKAGEQMRHTQQITAELVQHVRRIAGASEQQKSMSADLLLAVQEIGNSTDRTSQQIDAQNVETESLLGLARDLVKSVSVFKLPKTV